MRLGLGEYEDLQDKSGSWVRRPRTWYFQTICYHRPEIQNDLTEFFNDASHKNFLREIAMFNWWWGLTAQAELIKPLPQYELYTTRADLEQVISWLESWTRKHLWNDQPKLTELEPWIFDLALSIWEQWVWHPRIPNSKVSIEGNVPIGYWWSFGIPSSESAEAFAYELTDADRWRSEQQAKHADGYWDWDQRLQQVTAYKPLIETRRQAKDRIMTDFESHLDTYLDKTEEEAKQKGYKKTPRLEEKYRSVAEHYHWLYLRHMEGMTCEEISIRFGEDIAKNLSGAAVASKTSKLAKRIGLKL